MGRFFVSDSLPKILIVDDEPSNHRVYERTLESLNLEFVHVLSGPQALAMAHKHTFFFNFDGCSNAWYGWF